ncbi:hypothetical protein ANCDUO_00596 [Ancylostoma duodenale]|uniref:Uncharacterized protein n=1 Tax=Ancylostoma duodenale TaxID=51022 RepID=A0A0C2HBN6_9BILA|nr:hypothetical protein ANCDUO_00596 [Ancylostoma duodenale]
MILSTFAWVTAIVCSLPLYLYAKEVYHHMFCSNLHPACASYFLLLLPVFYECGQIQGSRRLQRSTATRAPYQRVTRSVQRVVLFHLLCWLVRLDF